jgi:hypothetical protein
MRDNCVAGTSGIQWRLKSDIQGGATSSGMSLNLQINHKQISWQVFGTFQEFFFSQECEAG